MNLADLSSLLTDLLHPRNFFVAQGMDLAGAQHMQVAVPWEIFCGRLLPRTQTRRQEIFDTWDVHLVTESGRSAEPVLSLKLDRQAGQLHVTRALECWVWEPYDAGGNVILSREVRRWVPELVGTVAPDEFRDPAELRQEIQTLLFHAVVGSSRLPLTSSEAPLPAFTLGQFGYLPRTAGDDKPMRSLLELLGHGLGGERGRLEKTKALELALRCAPSWELGAAADAFACSTAPGRPVRDLLDLFRNVFNEVALSPYTDFVDRTLALLQMWVARGYLTPADLVDFLSWLLRQLGRHLTAYDLKTFHHRGANYPDALLLDAVLKLYLTFVERHPTLFLGEAKPQRLRRRALRQGWLLRRWYEGLPVPVQPTSPGENVRVLPPPFVRVPDEEILDPGRRTRRLFADDPLDPHLGEQGRAALAASIGDLGEPAELYELGLALFLDRPLGVFKPPGEPDQTLLLAHEAFSLFRAEERLAYLAEGLHLFPSDADFQAARQRLRASAPQGQALPPGPRVERPGVVSLRDADRAAPDFVFLRTLPQSVRTLLEEFDFGPLRTRFTLDWLQPDRRLLILSDPAMRPGVLRWYDAQGVKRLELQADPSAGYRRRGGREVPAAGLRVVSEAREPGLGSEGLYLRPQF